MRCSSGLMIIVVTLCVLTACGQRSSPIDSPASVAGEYVFQFPSGQVESLLLNEDLTYTQKFYQDQHSFENEADPLYTNSGSWSYSGSEFQFYHWLEFCEMRQVSKMLPEPREGTMSNVYWVAPTKEHGGIISVYLDTGYEFKRVP